MPRPHFHSCAGSSPWVPTALTDGLPDLTGQHFATDDALLAHLRLLQDAREAHTYAEANSSLRLVLACHATNVPPCTWKMRDSIYYWTLGVRRGAGGWHGPASVTDFSFARGAVRLQHGESCLNRHTSQIRAADGAHGLSSDIPIRAARGSPAPPASDYSTYLTEDGAVDPADGATTSDGADLDLSEEHPPIFPPRHATARYTDAEY